jgi:hypothetical protein
MCWALISIPKILRDTQRDCGKPGRLNDYLIQVLARGDEMIEHEMRLPPLARDGQAMQPSRVCCRRIISNSRFSHYREDGLRPNIREDFSSYKMFGAEL